MAYEADRILGTLANTGYYLQIIYLKWLRSFGIWILDMLKCCKCRLN